VIELLQRELNARRAANRRYSLRAFARFLRIDHSALSQILRGKRALTPNMIRRLAARLGLGQAEIADACVEATDAAVRRAIARRSFKPDSRWLASVTGIGVDDINITIHRLLHTRQLVMTSTSQWSVK
jgi:transcriptional regulator with XRE-family HTH domain